jgi:dihydrofolate reductase
MRKIVVSEFITLDGVFEDPGGAEGSKEGGWTTPYGNDEFMKFKHEELFNADMLLLGRVTYEDFAKARPAMKETDSFGVRMNELPKYVASTTLDKLDWENSQLLHGDAAEEIRKLKAENGKEILVFGSGQLSNTLMQNNLVDEYRLLVYPVVLGEGKRLFKDGAYAKLKLTEARPFQTGVVLLRYEPTT